MVEKVKKRTPFLLHPLLALPILHGHSRSFSHHLFLDSKPKNSVEAHKRIDAGLRGGFHPQIL